MSRGPMGATTIWTENFENTFNDGIWERLQNEESANAGDSLVTTWPNGTATRATLVSPGWDGTGKCARFELRAGDVSANGERSELSGDGMSWRFREGNERNIVFRVKFATNWTPGTANRFNIITQFHSGSGSPPLSIQVRDDGALMLEHGGPAGDANDAAGIPWKVILTGDEWRAKRGQWIDINLHVKWSNSIDSGGAEVHVDGVLKVPWHKRQTMASSLNYMKIGMYRHPQSQTNVIWFDDMVLTSGVPVGTSDPDPGTTTAPVVNAGADAQITKGQTFSRTATENNGGATITARSWKIQAGPTGVGTTISSAAALSWTPTVAGTYVLRYSATNSVGTTTDDAQVVVNEPGAIPPRGFVQAIGGWTLADGTLGTNLNTPQLPVGATAGNLLIAAWTVDLNAGTFTPPAGWTVLCNAPAPSQSLLVCGKVATGGERLANAAWTTPQDVANSFIGEWSGVNPVNPFGPSQVPVYVDTRFTDILLDPAPATVEGMAIAIISGANADTTPESFQASSPGWERRMDLKEPGNVNAPVMDVLDRLNVAAGEDISATFSWTSPQRRQGFIIILNAAGATNPVPTDPEEPPPPPPPVGTAPTLRSVATGFCPPGQGRVTANTTAVKARLKVGRDEAVTVGIVYGPYATPNAQGDVDLVAGLPTSLDPGEFFYKVAMVNAEGGEWLDTFTPANRLVTAPTGRVGLTMSGGSCINASDSAAALAMANRRDHLGFMNGDLWYADGSGTSVANYRSKMDAKLRAANVGRWFRSQSTIYTPSDHDYGMVDDGVGAGAGGTSWNQVFREKWPHPADIPATTGCYWTAPWGLGIRLIVLDTRSFGVIGSTKLGATQKAWFKNIIATMEEDIAIVIQDGVWIGATDAGSDDWQGTLAERNELGDYIKAQGRNVCWIGGDSHAVGGDNGTNSRHGGPVYQCAPLNNTASQKGGPYSAGLYPSSGTASVQQYGRIVVTFGATTVTVTYTGYSSDNTVRKTITNTFPAKPAPVVEAGQVTQMWNGVSLVRRKTEKWNGSALVPTQRLT